MRNNLSKYIPGIFIALFSLVGFAVIWFSTPWGIGVGYDSIFYLSAADNLLSGFGLSRFDGYGDVIPLTHFPPLYSLTIAGISLVTGLMTDLTARFLAAILFAALVGLTGWLVYRYAQSLLAGILGSATVLLSPVLLDVSFMAMSELLFLVFLLLMVHNLNQYLLVGITPVLIVSALLAALMYLTRYVGLAAVALGLLAILFLYAQPWRKKARDLIIFGVISVLPILIFYARNWFLTGSMTNRIISFHPPTAAQIRQGISTVSTWILPARIAPSIRLAVFGAVILAVLLLLVLSYARKREPEDTSKEGESRQFVLLLVLFVSVYLALVLVSLTFFDASTKLNNRILSPVYLVGIIAGLTAIWTSIWFREHSYIRYGAIAFLLIFIGANVLRGIEVANNMRMQGEGFSGKAWRESETIAALAELPAGTLLFSNEAFAIYYLASTTANWIPENFDPVKNQRDDEYSQRIDRMRDEIIAGNGALVIFNSISQHNVYAPLDELTRGLDLLIKGEDGAIFVSP